MAVIPLAVLLAAVILVGGCGGNNAGPGEALAAAAQAAREAGSAHARMNMTVSPVEGETGMGLNIQGDAWMDIDAARLEARFTVMGMEVSLRYVDATAYLQFGGKWYVISGDILEGMGENAVAAAVDVLASIPEIIVLSVEVNEVGDEKVSGYECTKIEVLPDLKTISNLEPVRKLAAELDMDGDELALYLEEADVVLEVWVQKDDPTIRRVFLAASVELPYIGDLVGIPLLPEKARVEIMVDFPEYGVEVDVQPPADAAPFRGL
jgi:hypothetical protein